MFLETICIKNGKVRNLASHLERMRATAQKFHFTAPDLPDLGRLATGLPTSEKIKCSVIYRDQIEDVKLSVYIPRSISSLKLVESDIDYSSKFADRTGLNNLLKLKGDCDEILIVQNGLITDVSYANVVLEHKNGLFTPKTPLLKGGKRQLLLNQGRIIEADISIENLQTFNKLYLINAMLDIEEQQGIEVKLAISH